MQKFKIDGVYVNNGLKIQFSVTNDYNSLAILHFNSNGIYCYHENFPLTLDESNIIEFKNINRLICVRESLYRIPSIQDYETLKKYIKNGLNLSICSFPKLRPQNEVLIMKFGNSDGAITQKYFWFSNNFTELRWADNNHSTKFSYLRVNDIEKILYGPLSKNFKRYLSHSQAKKYINYDLCFSIVRENKTLDLQGDFDTIRIWIRIFQELNPKIKFKGYFLSHRKLYLKLLQSSENANISLGKFLKEKFLSINKVSPFEVQKCIKNKTAIIPSPKLSASSNSASNFITPKEIETYKLKLDRFFNKYSSTKSLSKATPDIKSQNSFQEIDESTMKKPNSSMVSNRYVNTKQDKTTRGITYISGILNEITMNSPFERNEVLPKKKPHIDKKGRSHSYFNFGENNKENIESHSIQNLNQFKKAKLANLQFNDLNLEGISMKLSKLSLQKEKKMVSKAISYRDPRSFEFIKAKSKSQTISTQRLKESLNNLKLHSQNLKNDYISIKSEFKSNFNDFQDVWENLSNIFTLSSIIVNQLLMPPNNNLSEEDVN